MILDDAADAQRPAIGDMVLDHVAHFLPDMAAAEEALGRMGFGLTPLSHQMHRATPDGPLVSAGTANRTAMLARGYLEFLATTGDTPNAARLRAAMARYTGVHLVCFGTADAAAVQARITRAGFDPPPMVALQRAVEQGDGTTDTARFAVVRPAPERMREGRIQFVEHLAPAAIWQRRFLDHPNGARVLSGVIVAVPDLDEARARWESLTGIACAPQGAFRVLRTGRGRVLLGDARTVADAFGMEPPALPWIAGPILGVADLARTGTLLRDGGIAALRQTATLLVAAAPPTLGGLYAFEPLSAPDAAGR
jgi:hypothetical protein